MFSLGKLVSRFLTEPHRVDFDDVQRLLEAFGYQLRKGPGSHRVFHKRGAGSITLPTVEGSHIKAVYVKRVVDWLNLEEWYERHRGT